MKKRLLVILITFNNEGVIRNCLDSIAKQIYKNFKLLIIDNNSRDLTVQIIEKYLSLHPELKNKTQLLKNNQNTGFAKAVNVGLRKTINNKHIYNAVLLINPDTYFDIDLFNNGLDALFSKNEIGACCPNILNPDGKIWWAGTRLLTIQEIIMSRNYSISKHINQGKSNNHAKEGIFDVDLLTGCALFIKTQAVANLGLFDEKYFMYVEDIDYSLRLKKSDYRLCIFSNSNVYHAREGHNRNIVFDMRRDKIAITSIGRYLLHNYHISIFIIWLIKLPFILIFRLLTKL